MALSAAPSHDPLVINGKQDIIETLATALRTCLAEQDSPEIANCPAAPAADSAFPGRLVSRREPSPPRQFGNCLRHACANFAWLESAGRSCPTFDHRELVLLSSGSGLSPSVIRPSTSRPPGPTAGLDEPSANAFPFFRLCWNQGEIRSRQLRPVVSSDRRIAVEIPAARSSCEGQGFRAAEIAGRRGALSSSEGNVLKIASPPGHFGKLVFQPKNEFAKMPGASFQTRPKGK